MPHSEKRGRNRGWTGDTMSSTNSISRHAIMGCKTERLTYTVSIAVALLKVIRKSSWFWTPCSWIRIPLASGSQILFSSLKHFRRIIYTTFRLRVFFSNSDVLECLKNCSLNNVSQRSPLMLFLKTVSTENSVSLLTVSQLVTALFT